MYFFSSQESKIIFQAA